MTYNVVNVTVAADPSPVDLSPAEGNVVAVPNGTLWPDTNANPIVPMVVHGTLGDGLNGAPAGGSSCIIELVASDNFSAGVLNWDFLINIRELPTINVSGVPVNFASGANQNVWAILATAGWTPGSQV